MIGQVIVADDHPLFRSALVQAVQSVLDCETLQAANFQEVEALLAQHQDVELVLLDLNMPGNDGLTGLTSIVNAYPGVAVLVVSAQEDPHTIQRAMDFGSSGFIPKSSPIDILSEAVESVLEGGNWLPDNISLQLQHLGNNASQPFAEKLKILTPHQFSVLKLLADGLLNKQIAYELNVQETTIKQHVSAILKKLEVYNRTQAGVIFKQAMAVETSHIEG